MVAPSQKQLTPNQLYLEITSYTKFTLYIRKTKKFNKSRHMHLRATLYTPSTESNYLSFNQTRGCRTHSEALQNSEIETRVSEAKQPKNPTTSFCFPRRHSSKASLSVRISCPSLLIPPILPAIQMDSVPPIDVESSREYS